MSQPSRFFAAAFVALSSLSYMYDRDVDMVGHIDQEPSIWRIIDGALDISAHEGQLRVFASKARKIAVIAGHQSGKTVTGPLWLWFEIKKRGPGEYGVVCPTFSLMDKKTLPEFKKLFGKEGLNLGTYVDSKKEFRFSRRGLKKAFGTYKYSNGKEMSVLVRFGYAENPDSLESMTLKGLWCDESGQDQFKLGSFQALNRRCARWEARQLHTTTPYNLGALKTQLYDRAAAGDQTVEVINFTSLMNPYYPEAEYWYNKKILPKWKFDLFYNGIFRAPAGAIYENYDDTIETGHRCKRFAIPSNWLRLWGIDFGNVNTACVKIAVNPHWKEVPDKPDGTPGEQDIPFPYNRRFYVYASYKSGNKSVREHIASLKRNDRPGIRIIAYGGSDSEDDWREKWAEGGLFINEPTIKAVEAGIDSVYAGFALNELCVFDDLEDFNTEIKSYSRKLDKNDEATDEIESKAKYHRADALRYIVSEIYKNPDITTPQKEMESGWTESERDE